MGMGDNPSANRRKVFKEIWTKVEYMESSRRYVSEMASVLVVS
jgi:hypothetical protein